MISIPPKGSFVMNNPNADERERMRLIEECTRIIRASSPFIERIEFLNKTKSCSVDIAFSHGQVTVIFKNPADELFDLNEDNNAKTQTGTIFNTDAPGGVISTG